MDRDVKSEENELVQQLATRLKRLRESLREFDHCQHVTGHQIHPTIREEIAKIYDEHGGLPILMKITKVGFYTIKKWHRKYKANPMVFREMPLHGRCYRTRSAPESLKNITHSQKEVNQCLTQNSLYQDAKTPEEMRTLLPGDIMEAVDRLKEEMQEGQTPSPPQKLEIARLVIEAGSARPIALLLGLNQKVILGWKGYLSQVINKKRSALCPTIIDVPVAPTSPSSRYHCTRYGLDLRTARTVSECR